MKFTNPFGVLTLSEKMLWAVSAITVTVSFFCTPRPDIMTLASSLIGVTSLIFVARGLVAGQVLMVIFSVLYGIISYRQAYYGEMATYLFMTAPMAVISVISWMRNPFRDTAEVKVSRMTKKQVLVMCLLTAAVTVLFYYILKVFGTANLPVSVLSVTTSFLAVYMTFLRCPYYAIGYASNDAVLIILWISASFRDKSCIPMIFCFVMFLVNDIYGFISWRRMQKRQESLIYNEGGAGKP